MDKENKLILYKDDEGKVNVNVRFTDEDVWLTRENLNVEGRNGSLGKGLSL